MVERTNLYVNSIISRIICEESEHSRALVGGIIHVVKEQSVSDSLLKIVRVTEQNDIVSVFWWGIIASLSELRTITQQTNATLVCLITKDNRRWQSCSATTALRSTLSRRFFRHHIQQVILKCGSWCGAETVVT